MVVMLAALLIQAPPEDTRVVVQGLLVQVQGAGEWLLALPTPFRYRERVIAELQFTGSESRWSGFAGRYVEARGRLAPPAQTQGPRPALRVEAVREVDPEGTVRKNVSESSVRAGLCGFKEYELTTGIDVVR